MAHACNVCSFYPVPDGEGVECSHCHRLQYGNRCPRCGESAPTRVHDFKVFCTACGYERGPLSGGGITVPLEMVGKPSKYGGIASRVLGWIVLAITTLLVGVTTLGALALSSNLLGVLAVLFALFGGVPGTLLVLGGKKLQQHGTQAERDAREQALAAAAKARGGALTASEAAAVLNIHPAEADALLTAIAKEGTRAHIEIHASGTVRYVFHDAAPVHMAPTTGTAESPTGVRVVSGGTAAAHTARPQDPQQAAREAVEREFAAMQRDRAARGE
jgi:hypothetical protein